MPAARIDGASWFRSLARKKRRIAWTLANGEGTGKAAAMFGLTASRVRESWEEFQGRLAAASSSTTLGQPAFHAVVVPMVPALSNAVR
jgi:hypothetical protein